MADYGLKRNAEGYSDPTAYEGCHLGIQAGEIYRTEEGKEYLILKNHGRYSSVLMIVDNARFEDNYIPIRTRSLKYTCPSMVSYSFNRIMTEFIRKLSDSELDNMIQAVSVALEVPIEKTVTVKEIIEKEEVLPVVDKGLAEEEKQRYLSEIEGLKANNSLLRTMYSELLNKVFGNGGAA